jgi:hypothetical protein
MVTGSPGRIGSSWVSLKFAVTQIWVRHEHRQICARLGELAHCGAEVRDTPCLGGP